MTTLWTEHWPHNHEGLSLDPQNPRKARCRQHMSVIPAFLQDGRLRKENPQEALRQVNKGDHRPHLQQIEVGTNTLGIEKLAGSCRDGVLVFKCICEHIFSRNCKEGLGPGMVQRKKEGEGQRPGEAPHWSTHLPCMLHSDVSAGFSWRSIKERTAASPLGPHSVVLGQL